jgi:hypothetical protein
MAAPDYPPSSLLELPEAVLMEILGKLASWQMEAARLTCRRLRDCCNKASRQIKVGTWRVELRLYKTMLALLLRFIAGCCH